MTLNTHREVKVLRLDFISRKLIGPEKKKKKKGKYESSQENWIK